MTRAWVIPLLAWCALSACEKPCKPGYGKVGLKCVMRPVPDAGGGADGSASGDRAGGATDSDSTHDSTGIKPGNEPEVPDSAAEPLPDAGEVVRVEIEGTCAQNRCEHEAVCAKGVKGYTCECIPGSGWDGITCADVATCAGNHACVADFDGDNVPEYACADASDGFACIGQFAGWLMPRTSPGGVYIEPKYTDLGDVVRDDVTALLWQQVTDGANRTWKGAVSACAAMVLDGHDDWRLPSKIELESLVDATESGLDGDVFPAPPAPGIFWTGSLLTIGEDGCGTDCKAWTVFFAQGASAAFDTSRQFQFRCVRSGKPMFGSSRRYAILGADDSAAKDLATGLIWQREAATEPLWVRDAQAACETLELAGFTDWRLPTTRELLTLVNGPATSEPIHDAYFVNFGAGDTSTEAGNVRGHVRCVR